MKYRDALKKTAVAMLVGWRLLPKWCREVGEVAREWAHQTWRLALYALSLAAILALPFLILLAPLLALLTLADHRKTLRDKAAWQAHCEAQFNLRHREKP